MGRDRLVAVVEAVGGDAMAVEIKRATVGMQVEFTVSSERSSSRLTGLEASRSRADEDQPALALLAVLPGRWWSPSMIMCTPWTT
jgi:hypothetical protein